MWTAFAVVAVTAALAGLVRTNGVLFRRRVASEANEMWTGAGPARPIDRGRLAALPIPVREYLERAIGSRPQGVRAVRLRHGGTFRTTLDGAWVPIRGEQYFTADPPGFVWWGRVRLGPGLWVEARDRSVGGEGRMLVKAASTITLADSRGPALDQGALLRLLAEMAWFPTALLDERHVAWTALDDHRALATLRAGGREVSGVFEFGQDGLPATFRAERHRDLGEGRSELTPFKGESTDYREVDGMLVPHRLTAAWEVNGRPVPYARFVVERLEYDVASPF